MEILVTRFVSGIAAAIITLSLLAQQKADAQTAVALPVDKGQFTLFVRGMHENVVARMTVSTTLDASIRNDTTFEFKDLAFELLALNESGEDMKVCDPYNVGMKCEFFVYTPPRPGETIALTENIFYPARPAPKGQRVASILYRVVVATYYAKYNIVSSPIVNARFAVYPAFGTQGIGLEFQSLGEPLEVLWDQSSYIDENGNASRLIRGNVRFSEKDRPQPSTVIPPGSKLREVVFPIDHIKQNTDGSLHQIGLFPETIDNGSPSKPHLELLVGKEVRLFLRLLVNDEKQNLTITFKVAGVDF